MITASMRADDTVALRSRALLSVSLTALLASITHAYEFGTPALVVGGIAVALLAGLSGRYCRTGSRPALLAYGLLTVWIIAGFGVVGGLWNHAIKVALSAMHGGVLPPALAPLFMSPDLGSSTYEGVGILTFVASLFAAYHGHRFARKIGWRSR